MASDSTTGRRSDAEVEERRLFIGMQPPPEICQRLMRQVRPTLEDDSGGLPAGFQMMAEDDLHLTLCFLGSFPEERRALLATTLGEELRGLDAPELTISGTGGFPNIEQPNALWAGVTEDLATCGRLYAVYNRTLQAAYSNCWRSPNPERRRGLRPHLTLARVEESGAARPPVHPAFSRLAFSVHWVPVEVTLFESIPDSPSARYRALASFPLIVRPG